MLGFIICVIICVIIGCFIGWVISHCERQWTLKKRRDHQNGSGR